MKSRRQSLAEAKHRHNHPAYAKMTYLMGCPVQSRGAGARVASESGEEYLALFDQYGNQSLGYSHPRVVAALQDQLASGVVNSTKIMFEPVPIQLAQTLAELTGGQLPYSFISNGGGEAIDNALKIARARTGRKNFVVAEGCFHGKTIATMDAAQREDHQDAFGEFMDCFVTVPFGDAEALDAVVDEQTAAVLLEPVQAESGVIVPPADYLARVRQRCDEVGALLILDEMQTAWGRCGAPLAHQLFDVLPDLVCVGKAMGGGIMAISAVLGTETSWQIVHSLPSSFGSSLGGNPMSCRAALEVVSIIGEPGFAQHQQALSDVIAERLPAMARRFPDTIVEVRGLGTMWGVELVDDAVAGQVLHSLLESRVTSTYSLYRPSVVRVQPPMVLTVEELHGMLDLLEQAIAAANDAGTTQVASSSPLTAVLKSELPADSWLDLLRQQPHYLDPFVGAAAGDLPESLAGWRAGEAGVVQGDLGLEPTEWADCVRWTEDGVLLSAVPDWLWKDLSRSFTVHPAQDGTSSIRIELRWDTDCGHHEPMIAGAVAGMVVARLTSMPATYDPNCRIEWVSE